MGDGRGWTLVSRVEHPVPQTFELTSDSLLRKGFRARTSTTSVGDAVRMQTFADQDYSVDVTVSRLSEDDSVVNTRVTAPKRRQGHG